MDDVDDFRERAAKLLGLVGSSNSGERANALAALDAALARAGKTWAWIGEIVARGELPNGRNQVSARLVVDRLQAGLASSWAMSEGEAREVREIVDLCEAGTFQIDPEKIKRAVNIADDARRRAGAR
jgi:hypothetical protein